MYQILKNCGSEKNEPASVKKANPVKEKYLDCHE
jgi:hypothetical protein